MIGKTTKEDFIHGLDVYGADLAQWPPAMAEAVRQAVATDPEWAGALDGALAWERGLRQPPPEIDAARAARLAAAVLDALPERALSWRGRLGATMAAWRVELEVAVLTLVAASLLLNLLPPTAEPASALDHLMTTLWERL